MASWLADSCTPCLPLQIIKLINNLPPLAICQSIGLCGASGEALVFFGLFFGTNVQALHLRHGG